MGYSRLHAPRCRTDRAGSLPSEPGLRNSDNSQSPTTADLAPDLLFAFCHHRHRRPLRHLVPSSHFLEVVHPVILLRSGKHDALQASRPGNLLGKLDAIMTMALINAIAQPDIHAWTGIEWREHHYLKHAESCKCSIERIERIERCLGRNQGRINVFRKPRLPICLLDEIDAIDQNGP